MKPLLCLLLAAWTAPLFAAAPTVVSSGAQASVSAAGNSFNPTFSSDGRHLVFVSHANNLVTNDNLNPWLDLFVRDLVSSNTVLATVNTSGSGGANADAIYPTISSNGQFVAFASYATDLVPGVTNPVKQVFLRDLIAQTTTLVSTSWFVGAAASGADFPQISQNGKWVAFESRSYDLVPGVFYANGLNVYARDLQNGSNILVSINVLGAGANDSQGEKSYGPMITPTGRHVAFLSTSFFLASVSSPSQPSALGDVYVRDLVSKTTSWVSTNLPALFGAGAYRCSLPAISDDGRYVVFVATLQFGGSGPFILRHDLQTGTTLTLSAVGTNVNRGIQMSGDGRYVLFEEMEAVSPYTRVLLWDAQTGTTTNLACTNPDVTANAVMNAAVTRVAFFGCSNVYVRDLASGVNTLVSASTNGSPSGGNYQFVTAAITPDGTRVAFDGGANDLVTGDLNGASDIFLRDMNTGVTELITKAAPTKPAKSSFAHSFLGLNSLSADGRYIVSTRYDDPSAFRDTNGLIDVFVSDAVSGTNVAVSLHSTVYFTNEGGGQPAVSLIENTNTYRSPIISADGGTIAAVLPGFYSYVTLAGASNGVFSSSGMRVVSRGTSASVSDSPTLSGDGRFLAFRSDATDLEANATDLNNASDVWLRYPVFDLAYGGALRHHYALLSGTSGYGPSGSGPSMAPVMTTNGQTVLFATRAGNLVPTNPGESTAAYGTFQIMAALLGTNRAETNFFFQIPKRLCTYNIFFQSYNWFDAVNTNLHYTNLNAYLTPVPVDVSNAVFSANHRFVVYAHADGSAIWRHDLWATQTNYTFVSHSPTPDSLGTIVATNLVPSTANTLVCSNGRNPSVSSDGKIVTYERVRSGTSLVDLFAVDLNTGLETRVSGNWAGGVANGSSTTPFISGDGRYVVFQSRASDLVPNDTNGLSDIFVRDRLLGVTMLVSANAQGRVGNGASARPVLAADGRTVAFQSFASDLAGGDFNDKRDVFLLRLGSADSDGDGMDDDWEMAYFNTLARDGSGDFDNDGVSDLGEFRAGTDPTNSNSVFRVLTVAPAGGGSALLLWTGNPARTYRAEFKDDLGATNWTALSGNISWNGATASLADASATNSSHRYYRVLRLP